MTARPQLLFVSTRFLFPADSGGRIRTTEVLRNMLGGAFEITLTSPATTEERTGFAAELASVCDHFVPWQAPLLGGAAQLTRLRHIAGHLPIPVATDRSAAGRQTVAAQLARKPQLAVFDFPHAAVLAPAAMPGIATVMFTHNVEVEIFARHAEVASSPLHRWVWRNQLRKMRAFECDVLRRFDHVVAVAERDAAAFRSDYGISNVSCIPTGVNLEYFEYFGPAKSHDVVFTGSMDWPANVDGIEFLITEIWSLVQARIPDARMTVIGRDPPKRLRTLAEERGFDFRFTGRVDDIRAATRGAAAYVIPLRVGGGTRIKAFEAMAMGVPVVSTAIGVEGLDVTPGRDFIAADAPQAIAAGIVELLTDHERGRRLAAQARQLVESRFSNAVVGKCFETICLDALRHRRAAMDSCGTAVAARVT
ncbi:MAG: glycosyltransferase family 4 protein [Steroidobacteraceae bacterium]